LKKEAGAATSRVQERAAASRGIESSREKSNYERRGGKKKGFRKLYELEREAGKCHTAALANMSYKP
jgi:hypothetical protein